MTRFTALAIAASALFLSACPGLGLFDDDDSSEPIDRPGATLSVQVRDVAGAPVSGAIVAVESEELATDPEGRARLAVPADRFDLSITADGRRAWRGRVEHSSLEELPLVVRLAREHRSLLDDALAGGRIEGRDGLAVTFGPAAIVDGGGEAVVGPVDVVWTLHDELYSPATLSGAVVRIHGDEDQPVWVPGIHGDEDQPLVSFGAASVELFAGADRAFLGEAGAFLEVPLAPSASLGAPELRHHDAELGSWLGGNEASDNYVSDLDGNAALWATVPHFSTWGAVQRVDTGCVRGRLVDRAGDPVGGAPIRAVGADPALLFEGRTAVDGTFALGAPAGVSVRLDTDDPECGSVVDAPIPIPPEPTTCDEGGVEVGDVVVQPDRDGDGVTVCAGDCDDLNPNISPFADEVCFDGIDQDCARAELPRPVVTASSDRLRAEAFCAGGPGAWECGACSFEPVLIDASGSVDPAGAGLRFEWHLLQAPAGSAASDNGSTVELFGVTLTPTEPGTTEDVVKIRAVAESCDGASVGAVVYVTLECSAESG